MIEAMERLAIMFFDVVKGTKEEFQYKNHMARSNFPSKGPTFNEIPLRESNFHIKCLSEDYAMERGGRESN